MEPIFGHMPGKGIQGNVHQNILFALVGHASIRFDFIHFFISEAIEPAFPD